VTDEQVDPLALRWRWENPLPRHANQGGQLAGPVMVRQHLEEISRRREPRQGKTP
jgi:hypothetical protein